MDSVTFFQENNLTWEDPDVYGKKFASDLCNLLWYLDGHHQVLSSRSCPDPPYFSKFVGYNRPEHSKHRKCSISNMTRDTLIEYSSVFQDYVLSSWMQQPGWIVFKGHLLKFIESITSYASYLSLKKNQ
jgi:hypothetical protein